MKKSKLLIPALATLCSVSVMPIIASCGCNPSTVKEYKVHFETNGAWEELPDITVKSGSKISDPGTLTKVGYELSAWYKDKTFKTPFRFNVDTITSNTTLYAKWVQVGQDVSPTEWDNAFAKLANVYDELTFWTDGMVNYKEYDTSGDEPQLAGEAVLNDIVFNKTQHYCTTYETAGEEYEYKQTAGEYFSNFFFTAEKTYRSETPTIKHNVSYNTQLTDIFYRIYKAAHGNFYSFIKQGGVYYFIDTTTSDDKIITYVTFNKNKEIEKLYYYDYYQRSANLAMETTIDFSVHYDEVKIEFPEGWDSSKAKGIRSLPADTSKWTNILKPDAMATNFIVAFKGISAQDQVTKIQFRYTADKKPIANLRNNQIIIYIDDQTKPIYDRYIPVVVSGDNKNYNDATGEITLANGEAIIPPDATVRILICGTSIYPIDIIPE